MAVTDRCWIDGIGLFLVGQSFVIFELIRELSQFIDGLEASERQFLGDLPCISEKLQLLLFGGGVLGLEEKEFEEVGFEEMRDMELGGL